MSYLRVQEMTSFAGNWFSVNLNRKGYIACLVGWFSGLKSKLRKGKMHKVYGDLTSSYDTNAFFMIDFKRLDKNELWNHT